MSSVGKLLPTTLSPSWKAPIRNSRTKQLSLALTTITLDTAGKEVSRKRKARFITLQTITLQVLPVYWNWQESLRGSPSDRNERSSLWPAVAKKKDCSGPTST